MQIDHQPRQRHVDRSAVEHHHEDAHDDRNQGRHDGAHAKTALRSAQPVQPEQQ